MEIDSNNSGAMPSLRYGPGYRRFAVELLRISSTAGIPIAGEQS